MESAAASSSSSSEAAGSAATTSVQRTRGDRLLHEFAQFRSELDSHYDCRERLIKLSRDITALSKKLIFALHRINAIDASVIFEQATAKLLELETMFGRVQVELLAGSGFWRYESAVSPGIQEYLEALTFHHYLLHSTLPSLADVQQTLTNPTTKEPFVLVTAEDYLGGLADLTGELMRLAIGMAGKAIAAAAGAGSGSGGRGIKEVGEFVRTLKGHMDPLAGASRWMPKKLIVLDQSLSKIEAASYTLSIRTAEYADQPEMLKMFQDRLLREGIPIEQPQETVFVA